MREFKATKAKVHNRGIPPDSFLNELIDWGREAAAIPIFAPNAVSDIYTATKPELGPWESLLHRRAVMLEVMRVLAGFESSWNWKEGIDTTRRSKDTPDNSEAGAWQVSADSMAFGQELKDLVKREVGSLNGFEFQRAMKSNHQLAMEYVARLMRRTTKHNGPLYRNRGIFPRALQHPKHSIYPWLSREAVAEFQSFL